ncbi:FtsW/RodA/SpoVE family cell cycle protein [Candidatus Uabimicrobium amorphum]|uniref:Rod shape-determining protein RodA n=1 Tax=Uabimicrobium amorphum TaxID=2596890 RepID=A0A5S9F3A5_UABAM|nr:FtsW/RodA/SpoVE family cell cycle protein [Candidatus Uabimicrobium amorphum]BBM83224.1 rod shape-determining protein RodA [Candidatus Uabimicrobium amorphum]
MSIFNQLKWNKTLYSFIIPIIVIVVLLSIIGLSFIYSTTFDGENTYAKQKKWFIISAIAFFITIRINHKWLLQYAFIFYSLGIITLLFLLICDPFVGNTKRWFRVSSFSIQPSEFMKYALVLVLAKLFSQFVTNKDKTHFDVIPAFFITCLPAAMVFIQPDLGTSLIFFGTLFAMAFVVGIPIRHIILLSLLAFSLIYSYGLKPYQKRRLTNFFQPLVQNELPKYQQEGEMYQLIQSLNAYGSGSWFGSGLKNGYQNINNFLPAKKTDFIFAIVGEEWGFLGTVSTIVLFFALFALLLFTASSLPDLQSQLVVVGITAIFAMQTFVNMFMTVGFAPITGIPLPFISYGGSSLLTSFIGIGLVVSIQGSE